MKVADFFCGAGGFSEGFRQAGFEISFGCDKWAPALKTFQANHGGASVQHHDILALSILPDEEFNKLVPNVEVIIGSPPCQAFSSSNKSGRGKKDEGISLLMAYLRIVARKKFQKNSKLKYWILENVPNVEPFIQATYTASQLGLEGDFELKVKSESAGVYNAKDFDAPTNRRRYLCGDFPTPIMAKTSGDVKTLGDVLESLKANEAGRISDCNYEWSMSAEEITDYDYRLPVQPFEWKTAKRLKEDRGYMGKMAFPENLEKPARTVMATISASSRESMILADGDGKYRLPTIREISSMMGFPLDYWFIGDSIPVKQTLVGNAVSPKLSYALAKAIANKEKLEVPKSYISIDHVDSSIPYDLNGYVAPEKKEKPKRETARFKYHIPYLIISGYRVELTNYHSNFSERDFIWDAEIHHGQGKKRSVHKFDTNFKHIKSDSRAEIEKVLAALKTRVGSCLDFQKSFCMTEQERETRKRVGPLETLDAVRKLLDYLYPDGPENHKNDVVMVDSLSIPEPIYVGYYMLQEITNCMKRERHES